METLKIDITGDNSNVLRSFDGVRQGVTKMQKAVETSGASIEQMFERIQYAAQASLAGFTVKEFVQKVATVRGEFQKLEVAFTTMLGSGERAQQLMQELIRTAAITPFDLKGVADGAKQLLAYGVASEKVNDTLVHLGDIAAGLSIPLNDLVMLYGTTMTQGRMFTQDLRQFMGRGIPLADELAKQFGVTKDKVGELVTAGKVGAEEFNRAIMALSSEGGKFAGLMEAQSKTISGQISNIEDAIDTMFNNIGQQSEGIINGALSAISSLVENYERVGRVIMGLVASYGIYKTAVMTVTALESLRTKNLALQAVGLQGVTAAEAIHYNWLVLVQKAQALLNATMLANPFVAVATAVAALTAAFISLGSEQARVNAAYDEYMRKKDEAIKDEQRHADAINALVRTAENESLATETRAEAMRKVKAEYKDLFSKYHTEIEALKDIAYWKAKIAEIETGKSVALANDELASLESRISELQQKGKWSLASTNSYSGTHSSSRTRTEEEELKALLRRREELRKQVKKDADANYLRDLTGISNEDLEKQIQERRNLLARMEMQEKEGKKSVKGRVQQGGVTGVYDKKELEDQLQTMVWEQNRRAQIIADGSKNFVAEARKAYQEEERELNKLRALTDPKKRAESDMAIEIGGKVVKVSDMSIDQFSDAIKKQQEKVEEAEKKLKGLTGKTIESETKSAAEAATQRERIFEQEMSERERQFQQLESLKDAQSAATIAKEQNRAKRELLQSEKDHRDRLTAIERQAEEMRKANYEAQKKSWEAANTDKTKSWADTDLAKDVAANGYKNIQLTKEQTATLKALWEKENADYANLVKERIEAEEQALRDYMKEYGSIQDQRAAITAEYDQKIEDAGDAIQKAALAKQKERLLSELDMKELQGSIDWESVFNDLDRQSTSALRTLKEQLRRALDAKDITVENAKILSEKIREVEDAITQKSDPWAAWLPGLRERKRLTEQVAEAERNAQAAMKDSVEKQGLLMRTQLDAQKKIEAATGIRIDIGDLTIENKDKLLATVDQTTEAGRLAADAINGMATASVDAGNSLENLSQAQKDYHARQNALNSFTNGGSIGQYFKDVTAGYEFTDYVRLVTDNVQSLSDLVDNIGLAGTEFGEGVHEFAEGTQGFSNAIQSLQSGDVLGAVNGIVDGLQGYGHLIERIGGFSFNGSNAEEVRSKDDELIRANESLELQMAKLTEKMEDANGLSALRLAEERKQNQTQYQQNIMDRWANDMGYHDAHHSNSYYWNLSDEIAAQINEVLSDMGSNRRIRGNVWEDLTQLTPEELDEIRTNASRAWDAIKDQGDYDWVYDALEEYADQAGKLADITEETYEKMSGMSKTALYDDFLSNLSAMVESSEDAFADIENGWQKMINNMVINNIIAAKYQEELEKWRQSVATATQNRTDDTYGEDEYKARLEELRNELLDIYDRAGQDIEDFTEAGIIKPIEEAADKSEEAVNSLTESIRSAFNSLAADTRQDIEEWGSNLRNAIIETYVTNEILGEEHEKWVKLWVERVNALYESLNSGLIGQGEFDARMLALEREFNKYTTDIVARIDSMKQTLGYAFDEAANSIDNLAGTLLDNLLSTSEDAGDIGKEIAGNLIREMLQTLLASEKYASQIEAIKVKWSAYLKEAMDYDAWDADWQRRYEEAMNAGNPGEREARMKKLEEEREKELERRRNAVKDVTQDVEKLNEAIANDEAIGSLVDQYKELSDAAKSSFGDMHDSFMDAVTDMENGAENLRKKLNETLVKDLIEKNVFDVPLTVTIDGKETEFEKGFDEYQEDWTRRYLEIYNDTELSAEQRENLLQALIDELMKVEEDMAKAAEELAGKLKDAQTDTTFKDMADNWQSALMSMEMTADEFAENVRQTMAKKIIDEFLLGSSFKSFLSDYQDAFNAIMDGAGTQEEKIASLLPMIDQWVAKYEELAPLAEKIREAFGITGDAQSAFSDLRSAFVSALTDMEGDAEDFRDSLEKILVRDLIEKLVLDVPITVRIDGEDKVFDSFNEYSDNWNKRYLDGMKELQEAKKALDEAQAGSDRKAVADAEARYAAASAYIDALIDELVEMEAMTAEAAEQFKEQMRKAQKDTTFTDMESNFVDALMDMEGSVEDFANDLKKTIVQRLVEAFMVSEEIKPLLDDLQNTFNAAMADSSLTNEERAKMIAEGYTDDEGIAHKGIDDVAGTLSPLKEVVNGLLEAIGYVGKEAETVFSNLGDTIRDSLMDAGSGVENFMEKLTETIISSLVDSYMATEDFQNGLQKVKDELTSALNDVAEAQRAVEEARKKVAEAKTDEEIAAANRELEKANGQLEAANQNLADAKQNASDFYTEAEKGTEEWRKAMESLRRDTTFKDMTDDWVSNLMDFNATAEDWAEEIGRTMAQRIIEQMIVPTMIQPFLDSLNDAFKAAMEANTSSDAEGNTVYNWEGIFDNEGLKAALDALMKQYPEAREAVQKLMSLAGLKPETSNALDSLGDTLIDHLLSLDDDVEEIGKQIGQTLIREMLQQMLATGGYADQIAKFKEIWQKILTSDEGQWTDENGVVWTLQTLLAGIAELENGIANDTSFSTLIDKAKEFSSTAKEGFSDLRGAFVSTLTGMESDAETFGRKIGVTMLQQMIDAYVDKTYSEQMAAINQEWAEALEIGDTEAIERIKKEVIDLYKSIGNDDVAQQLADSINELERQLDTTFSGMAGDWTSALMDMNGSASDWGKVIGRTLAQKIISEMIVGKQLQPYLDKIQEAYNNAISQEGATAESVANSMKPFVEGAEKAGEGVKDLVETILDAFGLIEEASPFDGLRSSFVSALMDMENDTEDFAQSIGNLMTQAFIDKFVLGEEFDKRLVEWQQQYESIMGGNYSEEERAAMLNQLKQAIAAAKEGYAEEAAAIHELMGTQHEDQTATVNMADKATYDQFETYLGIAVAQQMATLQGNEVRLQILATLQAMSGITTPGSDTMKEIRSMLNTSNEYLLAIKKAADGMYKDFGQKLDTLNSRITELI